MGKLISQGASRSEVVGAARLEGGSESQIEEVKGREIAESARQVVGAARLEGGSESQIEE